MGLPFGFWMIRPQSSACNVGTMGPQDTSDGRRSGAWTFSDTAPGQKIGNPVEYVDEVEMLLLDLPDGLVDLLAQIGSRRLVGRVIAMGPGRLGHLGEIGVGSVGLLVGGDLLQ